MAEELRFAMRCHGSRQRPALRRNCSRCTPGTTYVPAATTLTQANGVSAFYISPGTCATHQPAASGPSPPDNAPTPAPAASDTYSLPADLTPPPPAPPPPFPFPPVMPANYTSRRPSIPIPLVSTSSLSSLPPPPSPLSCS